MTFTYLGSTHGTRFLPVKPRGDTFFAENVLTVQFRRLRQIIMANWTGAASSFQLLVTWTLAVPLGTRENSVNTLLHTYHITLDQIHTIVFEIRH